MQQICVKYHKNCGFGGTSTKIGTDHAEYTYIDFSYSSRLRYKCTSVQSNWEKGRIAAAHPTSHSTFTKGSSMSDSKVLILVGDLDLHFTLSFVSKIRLIHNMN